MAGIQLDDYQELALHSMKNGCILAGRVGSGKSRTGLAYYYTLSGGRVNTEEYFVMNEPRDLYIITTAKKRDSGEWDDELVPFLLSTCEEYNYYNNKVVVDSWNNIKKYSDVENAFFIFDEDRVTGSGAWVKAFLKIARMNRWIILSATPGDCYMDYWAVFVANGFFRNKTEFIRNHVVYEPRVDFPKIRCYMDDVRLARLRRNILVEMNYESKAAKHHEYVFCDWDKGLYKTLIKDRWNVWKDKPIRNASELCYCLRRVSNLSDDRMLKVLEIMESCRKAIIFYNFDYELEALKLSLGASGFVYAEWNGHAHQEIPKGDSWAYLVQYNSGAEGWNCITTDTVIFYSQSYSYRVTEQAAGRIDRRNTPYDDLYYWHLSSRSGIDLAIKKALDKKKKFNETVYCKGMI